MSAGFDCSAVDWPSVFTRLETHTYGMAAQICREINLDQKQLSVIYKRWQQDHTDEPSLLS
jgi:hypothetical protein